jgi:hypothetical protein
MVVQVRVSRWMASDHEPYYIAQVSNGMGRATPERVLMRLTAQARDLGFPDMTNPNRIVLIEGETYDLLLFGEPGLLADARRVDRVHLARARLKDLR